MKDLIGKTVSQLEIPPVLEAIKERMVESRFNIDQYTVNFGMIEGRRNNLDKVILGLNRKLNVSVTKEKEEMKIELSWGFLVRNCLISGFEFFIISIALLRSFQLSGFLISLFIGAVGIALNLGLFFLFRYRFIRMIKRDLDDLKRALEEGKRKGRMGLF
jgi:hypothetical protein